VGGLLLGDGLKATLRSAEGNELGSLLGLALGLTLGALVGIWVEDSVVVLKNVGGWVIGITGELVGSAEGATVGSGVNRMGFHWTK